MSKVILITGASSGIGKATALQLVKEGHTVYGAARRVDEMKDLESAGGHAIAMDITKQADVSAAVQKVMVEQGRIDVLINNAGYAIYGPVEEVKIDDARRQFEVNIFGLAAITQQVLPHMREKRSGTIINISSMGGKVYTPLGAWYHATKHALEGWSDCLRIELAQFGINVVIVEPGIIKTEFGDVLMKNEVQHSAGSPYAALADAAAKATQDMYGPGSKGSTPYVIADVISKAIKAQRPKTRYVAGYLAKPTMWVRKWLGDRIYDRIIMSQVK